MRVVFTKDIPGASITLVRRLLNADPHELVVLVQTIDDDDEYDEPDQLNAVDVPLLGTSITLVTPRATEILAEKDLATGEISPVEADPDEAPSYWLRHDTPAALPSSAMAVRGAILGQIEQLAVDLGCALTPHIGGAGFVLSGPFGEASYRTLGQVLGALKSRAFNLGGTS